jgi:hypothetical protein
METMDMDTTTAPTLPPTRPCPLKAGWHVQVYRDAIRGPDHAVRLRALEAGLGACARAGAVGAVAHGFVGDLSPERFGEFADVAHGHGLQASAAFGLGGGNERAPEAAAQWMARVALHPDCAALLTDAEGAFEVAGARDAVVRMGRTFRAAAPDAYVITQPWPVPTLHSKFPEREFAAWVDADARQAYVNDWTRQYGKARYARCMAWFAASQAQLARQLGDLARPQLITLQGYGWADILPDLVDGLLTHPIVVMWSEPFPDEDFLRAAAAVAALQRLGLSGPTAVLAFQTTAGLTADGICGPKTLAALGVA